MPIRFSCACGKVLKVGDEHAGKRSKCPSCGEVSQVPAPEVEELEEIEEIDVEVVEEEEPKPRKKKRRPRERGGAMSQMYEAQARADERRDRALGRSMDTEWGRDEQGGWTLFGVHVTAGVLSGAGMLLFGLFAIVLILIFKDDEDVILGPRIFIGAIVFTSLGAIVLVKSLFFGEED